MRESLKLDKKNAQAWTILGNIRLIENKTKKAIIYYEQALQINGNYIQALTGLGNCYLQTKNTDKAIYNFEKAKARDAYLLKQMAVKTARAEQEKEEEMYEAEQIKQWMGDDDAIFDQYAQMCLDEWVAQGKNPKPMELVLQKQRSTAGKLH